MKSNEHFEILLLQYRECLSFIRNYNSAIWQIPSITVAINSFLIVVYLGYAKTVETRLIVLLIALAFTFVLTIQLKKHRFFQEASVDDFKWIQTELLKIFKETKTMREIKLRTEEIWDDKESYPTVSRNWWTKRRAYNWFLGLMYVSMFVVLLLLLYELKIFLDLIMIN